MQKSTLFPCSETTFTPAVERTEPVFWIRRLVILSAIESETPIRDITFRRGLNIVQTAPRMETDAEVLGHSVGKTLLTRLIRYSLGEPTFAVKDQKSRILSQLPDACIVTHWVVDGTDWCVFRPLHSTRKSEAFAVRTGDWRDVVESDANRVAFTDFTDALDNATFSNLHDVSTSTLDDNRWLKALAFLTRDWQCGYRQFNDWRNSDSESGVSIERHEASRFARWLLDLIDLEELPLWDRHRTLLEQQKRLKTQRNMGRQLIAALEPGLREKLDVEDIGEGLFAKAISDTVESRIGQLKRLRDDDEMDSRIESLEAMEVDHQKQLVTESQVLGKLEANVQLLQEQLESREKSNSRSPYENASHFESCILPYVH